MDDLPEPPRRPRPGRPAGRPRTLDRESVVDAALRVLDAEGLDAVTIRRVAEELGTSGTALYTYVRDKDQLVELLVDRVIGEIDAPADGSLPWQEQMRRHAREIRRTFAEHRDVARATLGHVPQGERAMVVMDAVLGRLREAGLPDRVLAFGSDLLALYVVPDRTAALTGDLAALYVGAFAYEESVWAARGVDTEAAVEFIAGLRSYLESLPADRFPNLVALAGPLTAGDPQGNDRFEFGLDVLIAGLEALAARER
jgi:AcrR family transcriptional regulator